MGCYMNHQRLHQANSRKRENEMKSNAIGIFMMLLLVTASSAGAGEFENFSKDRQLQGLSAPVRCFFDAAAQNNRKALMACFAKEKIIDWQGKYR